jgi:beta-lactamase superfamily II metal-dependent hydrolase
MKTFSIEMLPGNEGDCLWIEYGNAAKPHRVLIDAGRKSTYKHLKKRFEELPADQRTFELLVISHIDRDHIEGVIEILADPDQPVAFKDVWFNGYDHLVEATAEPMGVAQGEVLTAWLKDRGVPWNASFGNGPVFCPDDADIPKVTLSGGLELTLLSPNAAKLALLLKEWERVCKKEGLVPGAAFEIDEADDEPFGAPNVDLLVQEPFQGDAAEANGSSIAFIAEFEGRRVLFGADAHPDLLETSLAAIDAGKIAFDAVKVPHHGSSHNISDALLARIDCPTWLFSTNGNFFHHPSPSAVARVIKHGNAKELVFNYRSDENAVWDSAALKNKFGYAARYPDAATPGVNRVELL